MLTKRVRCLWDGKIVLGECMTIIERLGTVRNSSSKEKYFCSMNSVSRMDINDDSLSKGNWCNCSMHNKDIVCH